MTDANGTYTLRGVQPGTITVTCEMQGFMSAGESVAFTGAPPRIAFRMQVAPLVDELKTGQYNTVLVVSYGLGPRKAAYGPDNALAKFVPRFGSEYQNSTASATGESAKHTGPSFHAAKTNAAADTTTNTTASPIVIAPRGSSRPAPRRPGPACPSPTP